MNTWNMSVKAKLFATLALTGSVMIVVGVIGLGGTKSTNADLDAIISNRFMPTGWVGNIESSERAVLEKAEEVVIRQDAAAVKAALEVLQEREGEVKELLRKLDATELTDKERDIVAQFRGHGADVLTLVQEALFAAQSGNFSAAESTLIEKARPAYEKLNNAGD